MRVKRFSIVFVAFVAGLSLPAVSAQEDEQAFVGATIIDGTGNAPIERGTLIVRDGRVAAVGAAGAIDVTADANLIDVSGKFIIPGLINAHGHVGATLGLESGHYSRENVLRQLRLCASYGITTVLSLDGDRKEGRQVRDEQATPDLDRSRLFIAGSAITGDTPGEARAQVNENAANGVDFIKIRVDDQLGRGKKMPREVYRAVIDQAGRHSLPVAAHLVYLEDAKDLLETGVGYIVHSVRDELVDDEFIRLIKAKNVPYCPTLMREVSVYVYEDVPEFFSDPFFLKSANPAVLDQLRDPERQERIKGSSSALWYKQHLDTAKRNLKTLADEGVAIVMGTDSGPPARFQGYFEHKEMELMADAGLAPMQIIVSATSAAAEAIRRDDIGSLKVGNWADLLVLSKNPLDDISNTQSIESVWIAGNEVE